MKLHGTRHGAPVTVVAALLVLAAAGSAVSSELRAQATFEAYRAMAPNEKLELFRALKTTDRYREMAKRTAPPGDWRALLEAGSWDDDLRWLPLSPLDILELSMRDGHWEAVIPKMALELHRRWLALHYGTVPAVPSPSRTEGPAAAASTGSTVSENVNVAADGSPGPEAYQGEVQIAVDPTDPRRIVIAANTWDGLDPDRCTALGTQAIFTSWDGGTTWRYDCAPGPDAFGLEPPPGAGNASGSDPAVFWDDRGTAFLEYMLLPMTCLPLCIARGSAMVLARSTDGGITWEPWSVLADDYDTRTPFNDKEFLVVDRSPASPYHGRLYSCWDRDNDEVVAWSSDGGRTWHRVDLPDDPEGWNDLGCDMGIAADGTVHLVFDAISPANDAEITVYTRSADGGRTWSTPSVLNRASAAATFGTALPPAQENRGTAAFGAIDVDTSGGPCSGTVYAVFADAPGQSEGHDLDVFVVRSRDGGDTWSEPVRVNDDPAGSTQFMPFLVVDPVTGDVVVAWYDTRNDPIDRAADIYLARSRDCGASFEPNIRVSEPSAGFANAGISWSDENREDNPEANPNQYGDYLGLDAHRGTTYVAWTDSRGFFPLATDASRSQVENVAFATVDLPPDCSTFNEPVEDLLASIFGGDAGALCPDLDGDGTSGAADLALRIGRGASRHP